MLGMQNFVGSPQSAAASLQVDPNQSLQTVLKAFPRVKGEEPEMIPEKSIEVPKGCSYCLTCLFYGILTLVLLYMAGVASDFFFMALPKVASGDCAQDKWHTTKEDSCHYLLMNTLTLGVDQRCHREKPSKMLDEDFQTACGGRWEAFIGVGFAACAACCLVLQKLAELPGTICLYQDFMTVVAENGNDFKALFYADITAAKLRSGEIMLSAKAIASYSAPDKEIFFGNKDETVGRALSIQGETSVTVVCEEDEDGKAFSDKLATKLPLPIEGLESTPLLASGQSTSMLAGRLQQVIDARSSNKSEHILQIPKTCDMATAVICAFLQVIIGWYGMTLIGNTIDWAERNATGVCEELDRPGVDFCSVYMIFWPIKTLSDWADYLALALLIIGVLVVVPLMLAWTFDQSYHFDQDKFWTAPRDIHEAQELKVMFWDDVSNAEVIDTDLEKCIRITGNVTYKLTGGAKKPFQVIAEFKDDQTQDVTIVDPCCASCCCQGRAACVYDRDLQSVTREFLPGIEIAQAADSDESSEES